MTDIIHKKQILIVEEEGKVVMDARGELVEAPSCANQALIYRPGALSNIF